MFDTQHLKEFLDQTNDGILIADTKGKIIYVNDSIVTKTGYNRDELVGSYTSLFKSDNQGDTFYKTMWDDLLEVGLWRGEITNRKKNGEEYSELLSISKVVIGEEDFYIAIYSDVTKIKKKEEDLQILLNHDELTGLPNLTFLRTLLEIGLFHSSRNETKVAICLCGIDDFNTLRSKYDEETLNGLVIKVATRLKTSIRDTDIIARINDDEFALILTGLEEVYECELVIRRILSELKVPFNVLGEESSISACVGITCFPDDGIDVDSLIGQSIQALNKARKNGKNQLKFFDAEIDKIAKKRSDELNEISIGIEKDQFVMFYQPQIDMRTGKLVGVESLVRWNHPKNGIVLPGSFLPIIEGTSLETSLGKQILRKVFQDTEKWHRGGHFFDVAINASVNQIQDPGFIDYIKQLILDHPVCDPSFIHIEILETVMINDTDFISTIIKELKSLGIKFSLDDFGTGYSSLIYLKKLPISAIKIDQVFTASISDDPDDIAIVEGIINLAEAFDLRVIAEGVETEEQGTLLIRMGCNIAQGFFIARPMPKENLITWIDNYENPTSWKLEKRFQKDSLQLMITKMSIKRWIRNFLISIKDKSSARPPKNGECHFSQWGKSVGPIRDTLEFKEMSHVHDQIHEYCDKIYFNLDNGLHISFEDVVIDVLDMKDKFIKKLNVLLTLMQRNG